MEIQTPQLKVSRFHRCGHAFRQIMVYTLVIFLRPFSLRSKLEELRRLFRSEEESDIRFQALE